MQVQAILLLLCFHVLLVFAARHEEFKSCPESGFCARNRHYRQRVERSGRSIPYFADPSSVAANDTAVSGTIYKKLHSNQLIEFSFELFLLKGESVRFRVDEPVKNSKSQYLQQQRYSAAELAFDEEESAKLLSLKNKVTVTDESVSIKYGPNNRYKAELFFNDVSLDLSRDEELQILFNANHLLNIEHRRSQSENKQHLDSELESDYNMFSDSWHNSKKDSMPFGPESVAADIFFEGYNHVFGIPEHADSMSLKDTVSSDWPYRLYNVDIFEYETDSRMPMYGSIPLMVAVKPNAAAGVFWVNSADTYIDINRDNTGTTTHWISENGVLDVVFFLAETPSQVNEQYGLLTGFPGLPQLFALGYHQCRWNYNSVEDVLDITSKFDENGVPFDTIWLDVEYADRKKYFTWDPDNFADHQGMLRQLDHTGRNLVVIIDPHLKLGYEVSEYVDKNGIGHKNSDNETFKALCWPGESVWIDSLNPSAQTYWDKLHARSDENEFLGTADNIHFWNDMSEPSVFEGPETSAPKDNLFYGGWEHRSVHNLVGKTFHDMTYKSLLKRNAGLQRERPFILTRSYFSGSQKTAAMWSGDNQAKWEYLQYSVPMVLTSSVAGMPFAGADVGGFFGDPSKELLTRWYQTGIWYPFFRAHAHQDTRRREPWVPGDPYSTYIRDALRLRYALLPEFYTAFQQASVNGTLVLTPLVYLNPENEQSYGIDDQFFLGNSGLMVKPVTQENARKTQVYIPDTEIYYDYTNGENLNAVQLDEPGYITKAAGLGDIPMFLKGGHIISRKDRYRRSSKLMKNDPYSLVVAFDKNGRASGFLYVDDGESFGYERGQYLTNTFEAKQGAFIKSTVETPDKKYAKSVELKIEKITILGDEIDSVLVNGKPGGTIKKEANAVVIENPQVGVNQEWRIDFKKEAVHDEL